MKEQKRRPKTVLYTIGHSTRPATEFIAIIKAYDIMKVVDIRSIPKSRHNPQFNEDTLRESLKGANIAYLRMKGLGGLRHTVRDSPNMGWRNASFRGFADYMQTGEFKDSLAELIETAKIGVTVIMCAEALPWQCHRSLIGDALFVRGVRVEHIMTAATTREHTLTPWARVKAVNITYPPELVAMDRAEQ